MRTTLEMKIAIPELKGGREETEKNETSSIFESELECKIDPNMFAGEWLNHQPSTRTQKEILHLYLDAKANGRLHTFTCMKIDPSVKDGKLVYQKGLPIKTDFSQNQWTKMLKDYKPSRNSRQMTRTEYVCRNLFLIQKLVESGYEIEESWQAVCDDSRKIGHYSDSYNPKNNFEATGSREICGFCDLGNVSKLIAQDPWDDEDGVFLTVGGDYTCDGSMAPVAYLAYDDDPEYYDKYSVGMIALD